VCVGLPVSSGRFCGSGRLPGTMTSSDSRMWIEYRMTSHGGRQYRGFAAKYEGMTDTRWLVSVGKVSEGDEMEWQ